MEKEAYIVLKRYSKWVYKVRKFDIVIDGEKVDSIGNGEEKMIPVIPGQHSVELRVSWIIKSQLQTVTLSAGEKILLNCGCPIPLWQFLLVRMGIGLSFFTKGLILLGVVTMLIIKGGIALGLLGWAVYLFWGRGKFIDLVPAEKYNTHSFK